MHDRFWWTRCAWPGLPQLWSRGAWSGLALAVGFTILLNLVVISSFAWTELFAPHWRQFGWYAVWLTWGGALLVGLWRGGADADLASSDSADDLFPRAMTEYLKRNWVEAQILLDKRIDRHHVDVEARLLLVSVLRRQGRPRQALVQLNRLNKFDAADHWRLEIEQEQRALTQMLQEDDANELDAAQDVDLPAYFARQRAEAA